MQRGVEMRLHPEMVGDDIGLVDAARPYPADIKLLQGDDIGGAGSDDLGDACRIMPAVGAPAAVDVVGQHAQGLDCGRRMAGRNGLHGRGTH